MIQKSETTVVCPACNRKFPVSAWAIVTAGRLSFLTRRQVLAGQPFRHTCPHCGSAETIAYDCLYAGGKYMVYLLPESHGAILPLSAQEEKVLGRSGGRPTLRLTRTVPEFLEKIRVMEAGLPDRALEIVKERQLRQMQKEYPGGERLEMDACAGDQIEVSLWQRQTRLGGGRIPRAEVTRLDRQLGRSPLKQEPAAYARIDREWALSSDVRRALRDIR